MLTHAVSIVAKGGEKVANDPMQICIDRCATQSSFLAWGQRKIMRTILFLGVNMALINRTAQAIKMGD